MDIEWKTVQFFLGFEGVSEVLIAKNDTRKVRCTCAAFAVSAKCKHTRFVKERLADNGGIYSVHIVSKDVMEDDGFDALEDDDDSWREFVYKYGRIETID